MFGDWIEGVLKLRWGFQFGAGGAPHCAQFDE
jgi:hypothetical protein